MSSHHAANTDNLEMTGSVTQFTRTLADLHYQKKLYSNTLEGRDKESLYSELLIMKKERNERNVEM